MTPTLPPNACSDYQPQAVRANDPDSGQVIVVLGMHRSGTSAITRALQALGVSLGDNLHPPADDNPKGFWEDRDCLQINEELLRYLGSAYDRLGSAWRFWGSDLVISDLSIRATEILKRKLLKSGGIWGFKDPRTCRLLEFWRPILTAAGCATSFVLPIRNPISVVRSLERRDQIPAEKGYILWLQHVVPAVLSSGGSQRRIVIDYDRMMDKPFSELRRLADVLSLPLDSSSAPIKNFVQDFLDDSLRHTQFSVAELSLDSRAPNQVSKSYRILLDIANDHISIDSVDVQRHFCSVHRLLEEFNPAFTYANRLEVERQSLYNTVKAQAEEVTCAEKVARLAEQQAAEQRSRAETAEQQAAEQHSRAETAEQQAAEQRSRAETAEQQAAEQRSSLLAPIRSVLHSHTWTARLIRRTIKLAWWSVTLQLPKRFRKRRRHQQTKVAHIASTAVIKQKKAVPRTDLHAEPVLRDAAPEEASTIWFDQVWYSSQDGGAATDDYDHFINRGAAQGRLPSAVVEHIMRSFGPGVRFTSQIYDALVESSARWDGKIPVNALWQLTPLFIPEWHDKAATPLESFIIYLRDGLMSNTSPGPLFDATVYRRRAAAADLPLFGVDESAVVHWLLHGHSARIVPTDRFDEAFYLRANPDIESAALWGFDHFIRHGVFEGRLPNAWSSFHYRQGVLLHDDTSIPNLYRRWHSLDFPNQARASANEVPAAYERRLEELMRSDLLAQIFATAQTIDPDVGDASSITAYLLPPFHDGTASAHAEARRRIPVDHYDSILCVPWIRTGGADLVAGLLAKALLRIRPSERVLVLRTDQPHFERANWLPAEVDSVDISDLTASLPPAAAEHLLRTVFRGLTARRVFNVNSRLCWTTLRSHGANLAATLRTYAYMFCWDQTAAGLRAGYPAEFFAATVDCITAFLTDTAYLRNELTKMYRLPAVVRDRIVPMFTPAQTHMRTFSIARCVRDRGASRSQRLVLWAGRLDRQKRFDLVQDIARRMPDVEFRCWGVALLDSPPNLAMLPANVTMQGSFDSFDDLPLEDAGAWLFTSLWEGMPTTIIELAIRGVAVVASAVGGVPELIQSDTGWPVSAEADADGYVAELRCALNAPEEAARRAEELQRRVASIYTEEVYDVALDRLLAAEGTP